MNYARNASFSRDFSTSRCLQHRFIYFLLQPMFFFFLFVLLPFLLTKFISLLRSTYTHPGIKLRKGSTYIRDDFFPIAMSLFSFLLFFLCMIFYPLTSSTDFVSSNCSFSYYASWFLHQFRASNLFSSPTSVSFVHFSSCSIRVCLSPPLNVSFLLLRSFPSHYNYYSITTCSKFSSFFSPYEAGPSLISSFYPHTSIDHFRVRGNPYPIAETHKKTCSSPKSGAENC